MFDVAIIGAGPAGATLARLVANQLNVLLIEKRKPSPQTGFFQNGKCCGGLLAPDAQKTIARMGLGLPQGLLTGPQLFTVRAIDLPQSIERYYQRYYINMDRRKFDNWLVSLVPGSVDLRLGVSLVTFTREDGYFRLRLKQGEKEYVEQARLLVGADGASSVVRKTAFSSLRSPRKYAAVQEWLLSRETHPHFTTIFDPEISDFYCWTIPKEDTVVVGAAIPQSSEVNNRFRLLKNKLTDYGFELGPVVKREATLLLRPTNSNQICTGSNGIALIGEAAGWVSPSSAEGLSYAFRSALACARSLEKHTADFSAAYKRDISKMFCNIRLKNLKSPFMYHPTLRKAVMVSKIMSMDILEPRYFPHGRDSKHVYEQNTDSENTQSPYQDGLNK